MDRRISIAVPLVALLAWSTGAAPAASPDVTLESHGQQASLQALRMGRPAIVVFWRGDCVPCRQELDKLPAMQREARPLPLLLVNLQSPQELQDGGASVASLLGLRDSWRALGSPGHTLSAFGGDPPRLPLSVLLDGEGMVRAKRVGELGPALAREWRSRCVTSGTPGKCTS